MTVVRVGISVALQDAGEATRALELATGLRDHAPAGYEAEIVFLSHGSRFEPMVRKAGFDGVRCEPAMQGRSVADDLAWEPPEIVGSATLARDLIDGERDALAQLRPDVVLHGFWPFANIAARLLGIPVLCFLPIPLHPASVAGGLLRDLPDQAPAALTGLPRPLRRLIVRAVPGRLVTALPVFRQQRIGQAIADIGWPASAGPAPGSLFGMLEADLTIVNDLPAFYGDCVIPDGFVLTGPVFAPGDEAAQLDPRIAEVFAERHEEPKVFVTMSSSGTKAPFLEAVRAVAATAWRAVVLVSPAICPLDEAMAVARAVAPARDGLYLTDRFVPAPTVNALADVVVSHGGQGTVQTALAAGTPLVGVAMQVEQQINLDHVADRHAGIRIPLRRWRAPAIRKAVRTVLAEPRYRRAAAQLAQAVREHDGRQEATLALWRYLMTLRGRASSTSRVPKGD